MGVSGLLVQLKPIQNPVSLHRYEGQTLGIDGYAWLHRAACSCAMELVMDKPTTKYLQFFIKRIGMLRSFKIEPYFVFDGDAIGVKKDTELKRRTKRNENKIIAERLWKSGEKNSAMDYFQKCVDITPEMAKCIMDYCKTNGIEYIVAPFEADAQMVYLENKGVINGIISEDSDLLIFGCRRLITKLNDFGECIEICKDDFEKLPRKFPLNELTDEEIRVMVCLSGCDYTNGIPKIGLITAMKLVRRFNTIEKILLHMRKEGKLKIPDNFLNEYRLASFAFQYQRVFCPILSQVVSLNEIPDHLSECDELYECIGHVIHKFDGIKKKVRLSDEIDHELHRKISQGELSPYDCLKPLVNRERKLQISSKSDLQSIDNFFKKEVKKSSQPKRQVRHIDKVDTTIKRRKLNRDDNIEMQVTSKFFTQTRSLALHHPPSPDTLTAPSTQEDVETELPESQLPTQIPSSFDARLACQDNEEDLSEVLSEVDEDYKAPPRSDTSIHEQISDPSNSRGLSKNAVALQEYRYSTKREPLKPKNINASGVSIQVPATQSPGKHKLKTLRGSTLSSGCSQGIVIRARSTSPGDEKPFERPAIRATLSSLSSRFIYKPS